MNDDDLLQIAEGRRDDLYFYPAVSSLGRVGDEDRPLQLCGAQYCPPLAQSENGVPALQGRFGKEACSKVKVYDLVIDHMYTKDKWEPSIETECMSPAVSQGKGYPS